MVVKLKFNDIFLPAPEDHPYISGYTDMSTLHVEEGIGINLHCRADNGNPPFQLQWRVGEDILPSQVYVYEMYISVLRVILVSTL